MSLEIFPTYPKIRPDQIDTTELKIRPDQIDMTELKKQLVQVDVTDLKIRPDQIDTTELKIRPDQIDTTELKIRPDQIDTTELKIRPDQIDTAGLSSEAITGLNQLLTTTPGKISVNDLKDWILTFIPSIDPTVIGNRGAINPLADWNLLTDPGIYVVNGFSGPNAPPASYSWGQLIVLKSEPRPITQIYISHYTASSPFSQYNFWVRQYCPSSWTPWNNLNPPPQIQVGGVAWEDYQLAHLGIKVVGVCKFKAPHNLILQLREICIETLYSLSPYVEVKSGASIVLQASGRSMQEEGPRIYSPETNSSTIIAGNVVTIRVGFAYYGPVSVSQTLSRYDEITATFLMAKVG